MIEHIDELGSALVLVGGALVGGELVGGVATLAGGAEVGAESDTQTRAMRQLTSPCRVPTVGGQGVDPSQVPLGAHVATTSSSSIGP